MQFRLLTQLFRERIVNSILLIKNQKLKNESYYKEIKRFRGFNRVYRYQKKVLNNNSKRFRFYNLKSTFTVKSQEKMLQICKRKKSCLAKNKLSTNLFKHKILKIIKYLKKNKIRINKWTCISNFSIKTLSLNSYKISLKNLFKLQKL